MTEINFIWKIRITKNYSEARNHLIIGKVVEKNSIWIKINCRTFHFGNAVIRIKDIKIGLSETRIVPWNRVELVNLLPPDFDYLFSNLMIDKEGDIFLKDKKHVCPINKDGERMF